MTMRMTRRGLLQSGLQLTLAGAAVSLLRWHGRGEKSCLDGKINEGLAQSLNFTEHSTTPIKPVATADCSVVARAAAMSDFQRERQCQGPVRLVGRL